MKLLEKTFEGKGEMAGFNFNQIAWGGFAMIYEVTDNETSEKHYEVFERREQQASEAVIAGAKVTYEHREMYPKSKDFGVWAWCVKDKEMAFNKFLQIIRENDEKQAK